MHLYIDAGYECLRKGPDNIAVSNSFSHPQKHKYTLKTSLSKFEEIEYWEKARKNFVL